MEPAHVGDLVGQLIGRAGLSLFATCCVLAGCGGASGARHARPESGAAVFAEACSACHSLSGKALPLQQGGDLRGYRLSREVLLEFTREMPVRRPLSAPELRSVVDYVRAVEQRRRAP